MASKRAFGKKKRDGDDHKVLDDKIKKIGKSTKRRGKRRRNEPKKISRNKETIDTLMESLKTRPKFTKMVEYSTECLKNLAVDEASVQEMLDEGVVEQLHKILQLNPFNEKIQRSINACLAAFAKNEALSNAIAAKLGAKPLVRSLQKHVEEPTLIGTAQVMSALCKDSDENVNMMITGGAAPALSQCLASQTEALDVVSAVSHTVRVISRKAEVIPALREADIIPISIGNIETNAEHVAILSNSLGTVANMSTEEASLKILKGMDACDKVMTALEVHPYNQEVLELGAACLANLTDLDDLKTLLGVTPAVNPLCSNATNKFAAFSLVEDNVNYFFTNEGVPWIAAVANVACTDRTALGMKMLNQSLIAMARLCIDDYKVHAIMSSNGTQHMVRALTDHKRDEAIVQSATNALASMITANAKYAQFIEGLATAALKNACMHHVNNAEIQEAALNYYKRVSAHSGTIGRLFALKAHEHINAILRGGKSNPELVKDVLITYGRMSTSQLHLAQIVAVDGLASVISAIDSHLENRDTLKMGLAFLENVALMGEQHIKAMNDSGAMKALLKIMDMYVEDEEINEHSKRVMTLTQGGQETNDVKDAVGMMNGVAKKLTSGRGRNPGQMVGQLVTAMSMVGNLALVDSNLDLLIENGAVEGILQSIPLLEGMELNEETSELWTLACTGLVRLCASDSKKQLQVAAAGAIAKLLKMATLLPDNFQLTEQSVTLADMCMGVQGGLQHIVKGNSIKHMIALCKENPGEEKLLSSVMNAFARVFVSPQWITAVAKSGGAEISVDCLLANLENVDEVLSSLAIISALAGDAIGAQKLYDAHAIDALLETLERYADNADVVYGCITSLCPLLLSEEAALRIKEKGGLPLLINAMRTHYEDENIVEADLVVLDSLATVKVNQIALLEKALGTVTMVQWGVDSYAENQIVQESGRRLLASLKKPSEKKVVKVTVKNKVEKEKVKGMLGGAVQGHKALKQLNLMLVNDGLAKQMLGAGGLQSMASLLTSGQTEHAVFFDAADAFMLMLNQSDDLQSLNDPKLAQALLNMIKATEHFGEGMDLSHLTNAIAKMADLEMTDMLMQELSKNNPIEALLAILNNSDDPELLAAAAKLLAKICQNPEGFDMVSALINLRQLIAAMRRNIQFTDFLMWAVLLLGKLSEVRDMQDLIGREGGVAVTCQIVELHWEHRELLTNSLYALTRMGADNQVNITFISSCKGVELLIATLDAYPAGSDAPDDLPVLRNAIDLLKLMALTSDNNRETIILNSGAEALNDIMEKNFDNATILKNVFLTLGRVATTASYVSAIVRSGCCQCVAGGIDNHSEDEKLVNVALKVLATFAKSADKATMEQMDLDGVVQGVVTAAGSFINNLTVETTAFQTLLDMCKSPANTAKIIQLGGSYVIVEAMEQSGFEEKLCTKALRLMQKLTQCTSKLSWILRKGTVPLGIFVAMHTHSENLKIKSYALNCFARLACSNAAAGQIMREAEDLLRSILTGLQRESKNPKVVSESFWALGSLCRDKETANRAADACLQILKNAVDTHCASEEYLVPEVAYQTMTFLRNLCVHVNQDEKNPAPSPTDYVIARETIPAIKILMKNSEEHPEIIQQACSALEAIAFGKQEIRNHMKDPNLGPPGLYGDDQKGDIITVMNALKEKFIHNDDVCIQANVVIEAVNRDSVHEDIVHVPILLPEYEQVSVFHAEEQEKVIELSPQIQNLLKGGAIFKKHSRTAKPRNRQIGVTADLAYFVWRDPAKAVKPENRMKIVRIKDIIPGRCTPQLQRKTLLGSYLADEKKCFAIFGLDSDRNERTVDLEATSEEERNMWVRALLNLKEYSEHSKRMKTNFNVSLG